MSSTPGGGAQTPPPGGTPPAQFSINNPAPGHNVTGSMTLTPIEHDWDRVVRLGKDVVQYLVFMGMFVMGTGLCVYGAIAVNGITPEQHELALKGLFAVGGGILGYLVKKEK